MTNVIKHARATRVKIRLEEKGDMVELSISDNGIGITDENLNKTQSYGIIGMRERIHYCGGEVIINGQPGKGTTVTVQIPLEKKTA